MAGQNPLAFLAQSFSNAVTMGRLDNTRALLQSPRRGKKFAPVYGANAPASGNAGSAFSVASPAGVALSVALATAYTGLCISNPAGSNTLLSLKGVSGNTIVAPAAEDAFGLIVGWAAGGITVHTTPVAGLLNNYIGGAAANGSAVAPAPAALVDASCTLVGTPAWLRWFVSMTGSGNLPSFNVDLEDGVLIPPGGYAAIGALTAGQAAGFLGSFEWEELPL